MGAYARGEVSGQGLILSTTPILPQSEKLSSVCANWEQGVERKKDEKACKKSMSKQDEKKGKREEGTSADKPEPTNVTYVHRTVSLQVADPSWSPNSCCKIYNFKKEKRRKSQRATLCSTTSSRAEAATGRSHLATSQAGTIKRPCIRNVWNNRDHRWHNF